MPEWDARGARHDIEGEADEHERAPAEQYEIGVCGPHTAEGEPRERQELRPVQLDRCGEPDDGTHQQPDRRPCHVLEHHAHGGGIAGRRAAEAGVAQHPGPERGTAYRHRTPSQPTRDPARWVVCAWVIADRDAESYSKHAIAAIAGCARPQHRDPVRSIAGPTRKYPRRLDYCGLGEPRSRSARTLRPGETEEDWAPRFHRRV